VQDSDVYFTQVISYIKDRILLKLSGLAAQNSTVEFYIYNTCVFHLLVHDSLKLYIETHAIDDNDMSIFDHDLLFWASCQKPIRSIDVNQINTSVFSLNSHELQDYTNNTTLRKYNNSITNQLHYIPGSFSVIGQHHADPAIDNRL
jgi:hypothetical protein